MIPGSIHPLIAGKKEYLVSNSLRFRASNSAYLSRTPASNGNLKTFTMSAWVKRGTLGTTQGIFGSNYNYEFLSFAANNCIAIRPIYPNDFVTTAVFRDPSAWYHIVLAVDTTQTTSTDRVKLYVNGVQITSFSSSSYPSLNASATDWNTNKQTPIGVQYIVTGPIAYFDGYLAEVNWINGQALTPSSFGQTDSATGVWIAKKYVGTYGTNGYYLKFADASAATAAAIGKDSSGNGNNWTPSGISVTSGGTFDQMTDTPTLNYPVLSPLDKSSAVTFQAATLGITGGTAGGGSTFSQTAMTFNLPTTGKWYFEFKRDTSGADSNQFGANITRNNRGGNGWPATRGNLGLSGYYSFEYGFIVTPETNNLQWRNNFIVTGTSVATNSISSGTSTTAVFGFVVDCDNSLAYLYENGSLKTNSNGITFVHPGADAVVAIFKSDHIVSVNFGQQPFLYSAPTGFKALNSTNLPTPSIKKGSLFFDATTRTGTGASASVSSLGFQPDLVWIKSRSAATNHNLFDSSRGATVGIITTGGPAEYTDANSLTAFNSAGYTLGNDASSRGVNINTNTYVDWAWKKGATPGFDIVTYTGNGANRTIEHSLGAAPAFMAVKSRSGSPLDEWFNFHKSLGATKYIRWGQSGTEQTSSIYWNNTAPTSSVFSLGTVTAINANGVPFVAYLWSEIEGFSKFGSYIGNGSTDGPFVFCNFRPKLLIIKSVGVENWPMQDSTRSPFNVVDARLKTNSSDVEAASSVQNVDFLSNGFKIRNTDPEKNSSGGTYIFLAYAENPFKYARAR